MASNTLKVVKIRGDGIRKEAPADSAITPGMLVELLSTGRVQPQSNDAVKVPMAFALENHLIGGDLDKAYAEDDTVQYEVLPPGAEVNALVKASASAIAVGVFVEALDDGTVKILAGGVPIGMAMEAVDNKIGRAHV